MIDTLQTIVDYADCLSEHQEWSQNSVEDYMGLKEDVDTVVGLINDGAMSPQSGTGTPETFVAANYSLLYIDTALSQMYFNPTFGSLTGWITV